MPKTQKEIMNENDNNRNDYINAVKSGDLQKVIELFAKKNTDFIDGNGWNSIMWASSTGNLHLVEFLVKNGADFKHKDKNGFNALMFASQNGHLEIVKYLINMGLDVNDKTSYNQTALLGAAENNHIKVVKYLLENGANPRAVNCYKKNSYTIAQMHKNKEMMDILIEFGGGPRTNPNKKPVTNKELENNEKFNQLVTFIKNKNLEKIKEFINNGFNVNFKNKKGLTPLMISCEKNDNKIIEYLLNQGADFSVKDNKGFSSFHRIVEKGNLFLTRLILNRGVDPNIKTNKGETPLLIASKNGYIDIAYLLIERKANVNIRSNDNNTPLWWASYKGYIEIVNLILEKSTSDEINNINGYNPLSIAVSESRFDVVKLLLDKKANINIIDKFGKTPLIRSVESNNTEMVKLLLSYNPDLTLKNNNNETAFDIALKKCNIDIISLFDKNYKLENINYNSKEFSIENEIEKAKKKFLGHKFNFYFERFLDSFFGDPYMAWHDGLDVESLSKLEGEYKDEAERLLMLSNDYRGSVGLGSLKSIKSSNLLKEKLISAKGKELVDIGSALNDIEETCEYSKYIIYVLKNDVFWSNRMEAAICLSKYYTEEVVNALYDAILDDEYLVRFHACNSLLKLHGKNIEVYDIKPIFNNIVDPNDNIKPNPSIRENFKKAKFELVDYLKK